MDTKHSVAAATFAILTLLSTNAASVLLTANQIYNLDGTTSASQPELAGTVIADVLTPFEISGPGEFLTGQVQNRVIRSTLTGTLTFSWRILPFVGDPLNTGDIYAFRAINFEVATKLDANYRTDGLGSAAPDQLRYFGPSSGAFNFFWNDDEVGADDTAEGSNFFFVHTDATAYDMSGQFDLLCQPGSCLSPVYNTFAPAQGSVTVPEPSTAFLLGGGVLGLFLRRRLFKQVV